jgi:hypothetical protein
MSWALVCCDHKGPHVLGAFYFDPLLPWEYLQATYARVMVVETSVPVHQRSQYVLTRDCVALKDGALRQALVLREPWSVRRVFLLMNRNETSYYVMDLSLYPPISLDHSIPRHMLAKPLITKAAAKLGCMFGTHPIIWEERVQHYITSAMTSA